MNNLLTRKYLGPSQDGSLIKTGAKRNTSEPAISNSNHSEKKHTGTRAGRIFACIAGSFLLILTMLGAPTPASARVAIGVSVSFGPPAMPYYAQPPCPGAGYIWTPGYWAWDPAYGYYWVPGTWVPAPFVGALWTPGYWGFEGSAYFWHPGYWGLMVGYYGDIDYGHGYWGDGYDGGYWDHDRFFYNRAVNRIETDHIRDFYYHREDRHFRYRGISFHGGPRGTRGGPTRIQLQAARMRRFGPDHYQMRQERFARRDPAQRWRVNHGHPAIAATRRPGMFRGNNVVRANRAGGPYRQPSRRMQQSFRNARRAPNHFANRRGFTRAQSFPARRYGPRMQRRGPMQVNRGRPMQRHNFQRGPYQARRQQARRPMRHAAPQQHNFRRGAYQARRQEMRRPAHFAAPQRHSPPQHQQMRRGGFQRGGGHDRGRGGDHGRGRGGRH